MNTSIDTHRAGRGLFVTGTDTGIGKTRISVALLSALRARGLRTAAMKPVASGSQRSAAGRLENEDALALQAAAGATQRYEQVNPYAFEPPIAPHLAAEEAGVRLDLPWLCTLAQNMAATVDVVIVEGVGGWAVPLDADHTLADFAQRLGWPVILVVGLRLGCLNHALLTAEAIEQRGLHLAGWIANAVDPHFDRCAENIHTLNTRLHAPMLGHFPHVPHPQSVDLVDCLMIDALEF